MLKNVIDALRVHPDDNALGVLQHVAVLRLALPERVGHLLLVRVVRDHERPAFRDIPGIQRLDLDVAGNGRAVFFYEPAVRVPQSLRIFPDQEFAAELIVLLTGPERGCATPYRPAPARRTRA